MTVRHERVALGALLLAFTILGAIRLNPFCLLEPDSPDYVFASRSLATLSGYIEIDRPGEPKSTFRPPGLPLLLVPVAWVRPFDVVACKVVVLATALLMLVLAHAWSRRLAGVPAALAVLALLASSPYTLLHATEVAAEVPFVACSLAVLLLLTRRDAEPDWREVAGVGALLCLLPFLRTIGIALVLAVFGWAALRRSRRRWLAAAGLATAAALLWSWRNAVAGGPTYAGNVLSELQRSGAAGFLAEFGRALLFYVNRLGTVLLPGLTKGRPLYERVLLGDAPGLGAPAWIGGLAAAVALGACAAAMIYRRREGSLAALYVAAFVATLAVYPLKHERLVWPVVPVLWIFAAAGLAALPGGRRWTVGVRAFAGAAAVGIVLSQGVASASMARTNLRWLFDGEKFYADAAPPMYYCDWQAAGRWLHEHSPPHARVLTRHSDVGFTARRYQDSVRFEELSPQDWRRRLRELGARYIVAPTAVFGKLFPESSASADPVYTFTPVHEARNVMVLEVSPNRSGTAGRPWRPAGQYLAACRRAVELAPERIDLRTRLSELLVEAGQSAEAAAMLRRLIASGIEDARVQVALGNVLLDLGEHEQALESFRAASRRPGGTLVSNQVDRGTFKAQRQLQLSSRSAPQERVRAWIEIARAQISVFDFSRAVESCERALDLGSENAAAHYIRAEALQRLGRPEEAEIAFREAARLGLPDASRKLELLARAQAADVRLADLYVADGTPGRALALLEEQIGRFPDSREVQLRLARLYLYYAMAERSIPLYRTLLVSAPGDRDAATGLAASEDLARPPSF